MQVNFTVNFNGNTINITRPERSRWRWLERASWLASIVVCLIALHPATAAAPTIRHPLPPQTVLVQLVLPASSSTLALRASCSDQPAAVSASTNARMSSPISAAR